MHSKKESVEDGKTTTDGKTVTINASQAAGTNETAQMKLQTQASATGMSKSTLNFGPDY